MKRKYSRTSALVMAVAIAVGSWSSGAVAMNPDSTSLAAAVMAGKDIHVTLDLSLCTVSGTSLPGPATRGSVHPDAFMVLKDGTVSFSNTHFTVRSDNRAVQEFMKYRVHPDGKVEFQVIALDATNLGVLDKKQYDCAVRNGVSFYW
ncbi:VirK family protein [Pandoraea pulmonicola]|uniref:VirK protein n=1 Tax=Pandoraea pulmonicola TaxID=93221 RepID=A0AAJ4Z844_PANPU|nr:VirK family protein [Pandoraea pulmonicola]AJC22323.1 VirK protein [Pandoraea pulmonicola]SUA88574.1 VirK protein [Pandoraea pulmonicola]